MGAQHIEAERARHTRLVWAAVAGTSSVFVLVTALWELKVSRSPWLLVLQLGTELNLATWWSGVLALLTGLCAWDRVRDRDHDGSTRGWVLLAAVAALLSLTEVGSVHERLDDTMLLVFLGGLGLLCVAALGRLWSVPGQRRTVLLLLSAFALLSVSTLQEHAKGYGTFLDDVPLFSVALEETIEVVAYLVMWWAVAMTGRATRDLGPWHPLPSPGRLPGLRTVVVVLAGAHVLLALVVMPGIGIGEQGDPAVWFPAAAFLVLALQALDGPAASPPRAAWYLATSATMAVAVSSASADRFAAYGLPVPARVLVAVVLVVTLFLARPPAGPPSPLMWSVLTLVVAGLVVDVIRDEVVTRYVVAGVVGAVPLVAHAGRRRRLVGAGGHALTQDPLARDGRRPRAAT